MKKAILRAGICLGLCCACLFRLDSSHASEGDGPQPVSVYIPVRDGVKLSADLYLPEDHDHKLGTVLIRTPYDKSGDNGGVPVNDVTQKPGLYFAKAGFAVVVEDVRGKFESGGQYFEHEYRALEDGYDTVEWITHQPWSNGKVGGTGCSFPAIYATWTAVSRHPDFVTFIARGSGWMRRTFGGEIANFGSKRGGAYQLGMNVDWFRSNLGGNKIYLRRPEGLSDTQWDNIRASFRLGPLPAPQATEEDLRSLPLIDFMNRPGVMPGQDWEADLTKQVGDTYWKQFPVLTDTTTISASALHIDSWFDPNVTDALEQRSFFEKHATSEAGKQQYMIIAPTTHCRSETVSEKTYVGSGSGARFVGDARFDYNQLYVQWFDYWLNGNKSALHKMPKIQYFVMGANEWRSTDVWPLPNTKQTRFYLTSAGRANTVRGDGFLSLKAPKRGAQDSIVYDPADPTPTLGGADYYDGAGSIDQRPNDLRQDVLVYTSARLDAPLEVTGRSKLNLRVASSARDTDFIAKLIDVYPDDRAYNVTAGILRMRYRKGLQKQILMEPGQAYDIEIDLPATSNVFLAGHRIRVVVQSADFPTYVRNLNTGDDQYRSMSMTKANNRVLHGPGSLSYITLPVISSPSQ